jgi:hypothetical protein
VKGREPKVSQESGRERECREQGQGTNVGLFSVPSRTNTIVQDDHRPSIFSFGRGSEGDGGEEVVRSVWVEQK